MSYPLQLADLTARYQQIQQRTQETQAEYLEKIHRELAVMSNRYAHLRPKPERPLTIPAIFRRSYDENFISDYLAHFLNPARNGLGCGPLEKLLAICGIQTGELNLEEVIVFREYPLGDGRIDLFFEWKGQLVVGIEIKIFSPESNQQTITYARVNDQVFEGIEHHTIYLTRHGHHAGSQKFQPLSYKQLLAAFRTLPVVEISYARQRVLWEDLLEHLEVYIIMSDPEKFELSEKAKLYLENYAMIKDLTHSLAVEWPQVINYLERRVYVQLEGGPWKMRFNPNRYSWHQIFKSTWESAEISVHYEYIFGVEEFIKKKMSFVVDVEGKNANAYLAKFNQNYPALEIEYSKRGIQYRPRQHTVAIASKSYIMPQEIEGVAEVFWEAFTEFRFLEPVIDAVMAEMAPKINKDSILS